jgi:hypothetical protein
MAPGCLHLAGCPTVEQEPVIVGTVTGGSADQDLAVRLEQNGRLRPSSDEVALNAKVPFVPKTLVPTCRRS